MRMQLGLKCGRLLALIAAGAIVMAQGAAGQGLTEAQAKRAIEIEVKATAERTKPGVTAAVPLGAPGLPATVAGKRNKSVVPSVTPVGSAGTTPSGPITATVAAQRAIVTRYDYATGVTTRTTVDLATGNSLHVRQDANYPTPLAEEEEKEALALARRAVPALDAIVASARPDALNVTYMVPLDTDASSPRYGHRLVLLWVERPQRSKRVLVDLSTEEVVPSHH